RAPRRPGLGGPVRGPRLRLVRPTETLGQVERGGPSQDLPELAGAEPQRPESGPEPAGDQQAGELRPAPVQPPVDRVGQVRAGQRGRVGDRDPIRAGPGAAQVLAEITPGADVVAVDDVERLADGPGVRHGRGEAVGAVLDVGQRRPGGGPDHQMPRPDRLAEPREIRAIRPPDEPRTEYGQVPALVPAQAADDPLLPG